jgi:hypothetical protein
MRVLLRLGVILLAAIPAFAQGSPAPESPALKQARHRLGLVATRATAHFRSADTIAESLEVEGLSLHPEILALRYRTEGMLDRSEKAIDRGDVGAANEALERAEAFLERFIKRLGGS